MKLKGLRAAACSVLLLGAPVAADAQAANQGGAVQQPAAADDILSGMFAWWDEAFTTPGAYSAENFGRYFTDDATLIINGQTVIDGIDQWVSHFQGIQSRGGVVEIVVPFKEVIDSGDRIYTYHVIRSRRGGKAACSLAAGHADVRDGKIASIVLVRSPLDPAEDTLDPQCWTD